MANYSWEDAEKQGKAEVGAFFGIIGIGVGAIKLIGKIGQAVINSNKKREEIESKYTED